MIKPCKKWVACLALMGMCITAAQISESAADDLYSDSNVSIYTAVDRYMSENADAGQVNIDVFANKLGLSAEALVMPASIESGLAKGDNSTAAPQNAVADMTSNQEALAPSTESVNQNSTDISQSAETNTPAEEGETIAITNTSSLRVRKEGSTSSDCLAYLPSGGSYLVLSQEDGWTKIKVNDSLEGYVSNDYITIKKGTPNNYSAILVQQSTGSGNQGSSQNNNSGNTGTSADIPAGGSGITSCTGQDIADYAVRYVGNPYVYGGTSLTEGADCSGFVMRVYSDFGIPLNRTAYYQSFDGIEVSMSQLVPGDLIIFDYGSGEIQHVGIYIGGNQYVHAANSKLGIVISTLNADSVYTCRRIIY